MKPNIETYPAPDDTLINILIVDDEPRNLVVLELVLDHPSYRLIRAESAERALFALLAKDFALLILDIRMPGMTGIELAKLIKTRKRNAQVPIIFLTACVSDEQNILEGYGAGAVDYLFKPINPAILRSKITVFAELYRKNQALLAEVSSRRQAEEQLRALTHVVVQGGENERARLSHKLHDDITQLLCAVLVRSETLSHKLSAHDGPIKREVLKLRKMLGQTAEAVESISRDLRPGVLEILGLVAVLRANSKDFTDRTGVPVILDCMPMTERLPTRVELSLYRIAQKAFLNVEQHAHAHTITVSFNQSIDLIQLIIKDDGVGFETQRVSGGNKGSGFGLLKMRERATSVGGILEVISARNIGTEIKVSIPRTYAS